MIENRYVTVECFVVNDYTGTNIHLPFEVSCYEDCDGDIFFKTPDGRSYRDITTVPKLYDITEKKIVDYPIVAVFEDRGSFSVGDEYLFGENKNLERVTIADIVPGKVDSEYIRQYDVSNGVLETYYKKGRVIENNIPDGYSGMFQLRIMRRKVIFDNGNSTEYPSLYLYTLKE